MSFCSFDVVRKVSPLSVNVADAQSRCSTFAVRHSKLVGTVGIGRGVLFSESKLYTTGNEAYDDNGNRNHSQNSEPKGRGSVDAVPAPVGAFLFGEAIFTVALPVPTVTTVALVVGEAFPLLLGQL